MLCNSVFIGLTITPSLPGKLMDKINSLTSYSIWKAMLPRNFDCLMSLQYPWWLFLLPSYMLCLVIVITLVQFVRHKITYFSSVLPKHVLMYGSISCEDVKQSQWKRYIIDVRAALIHTRSSEYFINIHPYFSMWYQYTQIHHRGNQCLVELRQGLCSCSRWGNPRIDLSRISLDDHETVETELDFFYLSMQISTWKHLFVIIQANSGKVYCDKKQTKISSIGFPYNDVHYSMGILSGLHSNCCSPSAVITNRCQWE